MNDKSPNEPDLNPGMNLLSDFSYDPDNSLKESELKYKNLVENLPIAFVVHVEGKIRYVNQAALAMMGATDSGALLGKPAIDFVHPNDRPRVMDRIMEAMKSDLPVPVMEERFLLPDGKILNVEVTGIPFVYNGKPAMQVVIRDITESRKAQNALLESEARLGAFMDNVPALILIKDREFRPVYANQKYREMFPIDNWIGKKPHETFSKEVADLMVEKDSEAMAKGFTEYKEIRKAQAGRTHGFLTEKFRIEIPDGNPMLGIIINDITDKEKAEEALKVTEEIFSHFLRYSPVYVFFKDKDIRALRLSKNFEEFLGRPLEDLIGKTMEEWFTSDFAKKMIEDDKQVMQNGEMVSLEEEFNGRYYNTIKFPIIVRGKSRYLAGFSIDNTDHKLAELKMKQLSRGIEQSPAVVIITDPAGHIEYVNTRFVELTGYPFERIRGKIARILKEGNSPAEVHQTIWNTILSGKEWKGEYLSKKFRGEHYWESVSVAPILDDDRQILNYIITFEDITDRKNMITELISARQKAEESDRLKSTFLANMSHEIRTPMNAIVGFADMLTDPNLTNEERSRFSKIIQSRSDDLMHLINDLLDLSRIESGNIKVANDRISLNALLDEIEAVTREKLGRLRKSGLEVICSKQLANGSDFIVSDPYILRQVFNNLIDNAIKFTETGSIQFGYRHPENKILACFVTDTGIGISPENQSIIFEHFRQAETNHPNKYGGTGLGLAICKGSLALIGGAIRVESQPGSGSTFSFDLPWTEKDRDKHAEEPGPAGKGNASGKPDKSANSHPGLLKGKRLLICEDDPLNLEYLQIILSRTGAEIITVGTGAALRAHYPELRNIDLILIDIRLPDTDGYTLAREIRNLRPDIPIIAQTAYAMSSDQVKSMEAGCNDYIPKPINKELLITKIRGLISS